MPKPDSFPRDAWHREVKRGYQFYYASGRTDLAIPPQAAVTEFFRSRAPEVLELPRATNSAGSKSRFRRVSIPFESAAPSPSKFPPAVSHLRWLDGETGADGLLAGAPQMLVCDMRSGSFSALLIWNSTVELSSSVAAGHPAHVERCDLDSNGIPDFVVADLGSFLPGDHERGRVLWVPMEASGRLGEPVELASKIGRVADVQAGDFTGDGLTDLIVAEFGWQTTGRILLLRNVASDPAKPTFELATIDPRHGAIHVPTTDLNGDGHLDFVALISQEHERIEAFINNGLGQFNSQLVFAADDPAFGSSGIQLIEMDKDGDIDVLYTNGDMYDSYELKPSHGVRWLENQGQDGWHRHELTTMPGVHRALAADFNNDGLLDIAACALVPSRSMDSYTGPALDSLIWLEQTPNRQFIRHVLETGECEHATLEVGDFDADGDIDLAVGTMSEGVRQGALPVTLWWNETAEAKTDALE